MYMLYTVFGLFCVIEFLDLLSLTGHGNNIQNSVTSTASTVASNSNAQRNADLNSTSSSTNEETFQLSSTMCSADDDNIPLQWPIAVRACSSSFFYQFVDYLPYVVSKHYQRSKIYHILC